MEAIYISFPINIKKLLYVNRYKLMVNFTVFMMNKKLFKICQVSIKNNEKFIIIVNISMQIKCISQTNFPQRSCITYDNHIIMLI